jgi:hypothetical protein
MSQIKLPEGKRYHCYSPTYSVLFTGSSIPAPVLDVGILRAVGRCVQFRSETGDICCLKENLT